MNGGGERAAHWTWLVPSIGYVIAAGLLGVTSKLALDHLNWPELVVWASVAYAISALPLLIAGQRLSLIPAAGYGFAAGVLAAAGLVALYLAVDAGSVSQVVPITASYPVVTLLLASAFLSERVEAARVAATLLVIAGVIVLSLD